MVINIVLIFFLNYILIVYNSPVRSDGFVLDFDTSGTVLNDVRSLNDVRRMVGHKTFPRSFSTKMFNSWNLWIQS